MVCLNLLLMKINFMSIDKIREKVKEAAEKIIEEKGYLISLDVAERIGIHPMSAAQYLKHNYTEWGLIQMEFGKDLSQRRWAYAKDSEKIPVIIPDAVGTFRPVPEKVIKQSKKELEVKSRIPERLEEMIRQTTERTRMAKNRTWYKQEKLTEKISLDEWIINLHKKGRPLDLTDIKLESRFYFGKMLNGNMKAELLDHYQRLIKKGKLKFEGGLTYLPD